MVFWACSSAGGFLRGAGRAGGCTRESTLTLGLWVPFENSFMCLPLHFTTWENQISCEKSIPFSAKDRVPAVHRPDCVYVYFHNTCCYWRTTAAVAISRAAPSHPFHPRAIFVLFHSGTFELIKCCWIMQENYRSSGREPFYTCP